MANHSPNPDDETDAIRRERADLLRKITGSPLIGATGEHPNGKLTPSDEGSIQFAVGVQDGSVVLDFGTPVKWVGMSPSDALQLAESLIQKARAAAKGTGSIITLNL